MMKSKVHSGLLAGVAALAMMGTSMPVLPAAAQTAPFDSARGVYSYARDLKAVAPSVVKVIVLGQKQAERSGQEDDPFRGQSSAQRPPSQGAPQPIGSGSGVIIDAARGEILSNNHVVEKGTAFKVQLHDGRVVDAEVVGRDP